MRIFKTYRPSLYYIASFLLPLVLMGLVLAIHGIYWGSDRTILASDGFHQYATFAQTLHHILHGKESFFYTFTSGLGLNFYALSSYYLGSFLSPLVYFFDVTSMPDGIYLLTLLKFGLIGLSMGFALRRLYPTLSPLLAIGLSNAFALMSFSVSQLELNNWLDVFILLPLIILGQQRLLFSGKKRLYYGSLTALFIQQYYFGFMTAIFISLYALVQVTALSSWQLRFRSLCRFILVSVLAGLSSAVMTLPSYLDLRTHGETFTEWSNLFAEKGWYLDLVVKNMIGVYDTTQYDALPMVYVGIFPLLLSLLFFTLRSISWQRRLAHGLLVAVILASFYVTPLDLFWQGMHAPNMFLHRYAWVWSLLTVLMAAETLSHIETLRVKAIALSLTVLGMGYGAVAIFQKQYTFLDLTPLLLSFAFLCAYGIILWSSQRKDVGVAYAALLSICFMLSDSGLNAYYQILGVQNEWVFPSRDYYEDQLTEIEALLAKTAPQGSDFFRTERLLPQSGNDSMKYAYHGISQFSSIRNRASSRVLDRLGFQSEGTNLNLRYQNNTIIADSLFGVSYNLSDQFVDKYGFSPIEAQGETLLSQNDHTLGLAILTKGRYRDVAFSTHTLDNQTAFLNQLSGLSLTYLMRIIPEKESVLEHFELYDKENKQPYMAYRLRIPANSQLYISLPNLQFTTEGVSAVHIEANGQTTRHTTDDAYSLFNLGYYEEATVEDVRIVFPDTEGVRFDKAVFYAIDTKAYQTAMDVLKEQSVSTKTSGNRVLTTYQTAEPASLVYTLPYDRGWTASWNGKPVPIKKVQDGFMAVDVPAGNGTVQLRFLPYGIKLGAGLSLLGLLLFCLYERYSRRRLSE